MYTRSILHSVSSRHRGARCEKPVSLFLIPRVPVLEEPRQWQRIGRSVRHRRETGADLSLESVWSMRRDTARYHACQIPRFTSILMGCKYVVPMPRDTSTWRVSEDFRTCKQRAARDVHVDDRRCRRERWCSPLTSLLPCDRDIK